MSRGEFSMSPFLCGASQSQMRQYRLPRFIEKGFLGNHLARRRLHAFCLANAQFQVLQVEIFVTIRELSCLLRRADAGSGVPAEVVITAV
jgi:hypothetical protein